MSEWQPIGTAPKDRVVLVNDNTGEGAPWCAAKWLDGEQWSGWVYDDDILCDTTPLGPQPTYWLDVPPPPSP